MKYFYTIQKCFFVCVLLLVINLSCDAPHTNPLDPENPSKSKSIIEGHVYSFSLPRNPIPDALILWRPENKAAISNQSGYFKLEIDNNQSGWLIVNLNGYKADSIYINNPAGKFYHDFFLNQIPFIDSVEFYSVLLNHYPSIKITTLNVRVKIMDKDNDIDSVLIYNSEYPNRLALEYNVQSKFYEGIFNEFDFQLDDLAELIGKKFKIIVKDMNGYEFFVGQESLNRIIKDEIILEAPLNNDTVSSKPTLRWRRFTPGFKFHYAVEIFNDAFPPVTIWKKNDIDMNSTSINVDFNLQPGNYFWVIWCVDKFLNQSRSKPASFIVK